MKAENIVNIAGIIYEINLKEGVGTDPSKKSYGKAWIGGSIDIATDVDYKNIVTWYCVYAGEGTTTYTNLKKILDANKSIVSVGIDDAMRIKINRASISLNEFYTDRNGSEELVSTQRASGGFVDISSSLAKMFAEWKADVIVKKVIRREETEDRPESAIIEACAVDDYRKMILPITFETSQPDAMDYFEGLEASETHPVFIKVWGTILNTVERKTKKIDSVFGGDDAASVDYSERKIKKYVVVGGQEPYTDGEEFMTPQELTEAVQNRNTELARIKQSRTEYLAKKNSTPSVPATPAPVATGKTSKFSF